ncbi:DNA polymerase-4 [Ereboglobus sp. PH5-5]|uniref:DNA polymerase Y family protein n=1 Tax=Ereboglobus sp. PH5-5 TaxID=2940529 RepID=UPI002404DCC7|nr:hypothetical protein [Ereboglobus sp. PH5-5]MDF9832648.1 DNA polymerase-4 [Ereboglobus sp. PH5-5]
MPLRAMVVDFNSFFASVEQQERPELRGRPVGIVPVMAETTGCIAVSIEAKQAGLKRNTRVAEARRMCPGLRIVESRPEVYIDYHRRLVDIIESCIHVSKVQSIDEVTCELRGTWSEPAKAVAVAKKIKAEIARRAGECLRSSIGVAPNWLLAKVASDMQKPDGLVVLNDDEGDIPAKLLHLRPSDISGIGRGMDERLRIRGVDTMEKLYALSRDEMRAIWRGVVGDRLWRLLHCEDLPFFEQEGDKSIGHGHVLPPELRNNTAALAVLHRLLQKAAMRLRDSGLFAGGLQVYAAHGDDTTWSDALHFNETQDTIVLTRALSQLWARRMAKPGVAKKTPVRIGVMLFRLLKAEAHTPDLFEAANERARGRLLGAMDEINRVLGKNTVYFGGAHGATADAPMRIAFTRIPKPELEEIDKSLKGRFRRGKR